ncbi:MAG: hypothetical protein ACHQXG_09995, partial [Nitrososphaerales archaeon]
LQTIINVYSLINYVQDGHALICRKDTVSTLFGITDGLSPIMTNTNWLLVNENLVIRCLTIHHDKGFVIE